MCTCNASGGNAHVSVALIAHFAMLTFVVAAAVVYVVSPFLLLFLRHFAIALTK